MSNRGTGSGEGPRGEETADMLECECEICQQVIDAKTLPLLEMAYTLHKRDHELERVRATNRVKLVRNGSGWILTKSSKSDVPY